MSEQGDRLKQAISETGLAMQEACERFGWSYNTVKSNVNGNASFSFKKATEYAAKLKVRAEWLYTGTLPIREAAKSSSRISVGIPLLDLSSVEHFNEDQEYPNADAFNTISINDLPPGDWIAVNVRGDSMDRVSPEGSRIFVNRDDQDLEAGGFYLFTVQGNVLYRRYYDEPVPRVEPYSGNLANRPIYLTPEVEWKVLGRVYRSAIDLI